MFSVPSACQSAACKCMHCMHSSNHLYGMVEFLRLVQYQLLIVINMFFIIITLQIISMQYKLITLMNYSVITSCSVHASSWPIASALQLGSNWIEHCMNGISQVIKKIISKIRDKEDWCHKKGETRSHHT